MHYTLYPYNDIRQKKKMLRKSSGRENTFPVFIEKNLGISGPHTVQTCVIQGSAASRAELVITWTKGKGSHGGAHIPHQLRVRRFLTAK